MDNGEAIGGNVNIYIACLDLQDKVQIKVVQVEKVVGNNFVLSEKITGVKAISTMHWDSVCKSVGKKTLPRKSAGDNWERGYVFYNQIDAMKRLETYIDKLEDKAIKQLDFVASQKARLSKLIGEC